MAFSLSMGAVRPILALSLLAFQATDVGVAMSSDDERTGFGLHPDSLHFGKVSLDSSRELSFELRNRGDSVLEAVIRKCFETSGEFRYSPLSIITLDPHRDATITVTYSPRDIGRDKGCLDVRIPDKGETVEVVALQADGVEEAVDGVDFDIAGFNVSDRFRPQRDEVVKIRVELRNAGTVNGPREVTVIGVQKGAEVYARSREVGVSPRNDGVKKVRFPDHAPPDSGDILWQASIADDDPDLDRSLAVTSVGEPFTGVSSGLDLDIRRFRVTPQVAAGKRAVTAKVLVINHGTIDEPRPAVLLGIQNGVAIYTHTIEVADSLDKPGATRFKFPALRPAEAGDILWMVKVDDENPDADEALGVTRVTP